jgi:hypothetical protein
VRKLQRSALFVCSVLQLAIFFAVTVKPAHAYVDPGSGLLSLQIGGSILAGVVFVLRTKVRKLFRMKPKPEIDPNAGANETAAYPVETSG